MESAFSKREDLEYTFIFKNELSPRYEFVKLNNTRKCCRCGIYDSHIFKCIDTEDVFRLKLFFCKRCAFTIPLWK